MITSNLWILGKVGSSSWASLSWVGCLLLGIGYHSYPQIGYHSYPQIPKRMHLSLLTRWGSDRTCTASMVCKQVYGELSKLSLVQSHARHEITIVMKTFNKNINWKTAVLLWGNRSWMVNLVNVVGFVNIGWFLWQLQSPLCLVAVSSKGI